MQSVSWASIINTLPLFLFCNWFRTWSEQLVSNRESLSMCRRRCESWGSGLRWIKKHWRKLHGHWNREQSVVRILQDTSMLSWLKWWEHWETWFGVSKSFVTKGSCLEYWPVYDTIQATTVLKDKIIWVLIGFCAKKQHCTVFISQAICHKTYSTKQDKWTDTCCCLIILSSNSCPPVIL